MYNRLYKDLGENNLLFSKQFRFREGNSTDLALVELISNIYNFFNQSKYTLGVFVELSKAFDIVDHEILLSKLNLCGIKSKKLKWFAKYFSNRK